MEFDSVRFLNNRERVEKFIYDMIDDNGLFRNYPHYERSLVRVKTKRRLIYDELERKLDDWKKRTATGSSLTLKQPRGNNNMQRYKITDNLLSNIRVNFLEVSARMYSGGGSHNYTVVPHKISSIDFGGTLQELIEEKLMTPLVRDLRKHHNVKVDEGVGSVTMYVNRHSSMCPLPCPKIMADRPPFQEQCLGQRITLGSYFLPFLSEEEKEEEDEEGGDGDHPADWGILGNLFIYQNDCIFGLGRPVNRIDGCSTFTDTDDFAPVNCVISFTLNEIGLFNNKPILYLRAEDKVYYSSVKLNEIESARSIIGEILVANPGMRTNILVKCRKKGKIIPPELEAKRKREEEEEEE